MTLDELAAYIEANGIGTRGTDLFEGLEPPSPDDCVTLFEYAGGAGDYVFGTGGAYNERPRVQVLVRNTTYTGARSKIHAVYALLDGLANTTLSGTLYRLITAVQPPFAMPLDLNNRYKMACNFAIQKDIS